MLSEEQVSQFKTFGFVIMRSVFTSDELKTVQEEFNRIDVLVNAADVIGAPG